MNTATAHKKAHEVWMPNGQAYNLASAPAWFKEAQQEALEEYQSVGLPGVRDEEWRYTKLRELKATELAFATSAGVAAALDATENTRLVFIDGFYSQELSSHSELSDGISCTPLSTALLEQSDLLDEVFGSTLPETQHGFTVLNSAFASEGYVLTIAKNVVSNTPIEVVFLNNNGGASHTRNIIVAEQHSQCSIIERHYSQSGGSYLNNCITEITAKDGAKIDHYKIQDESDQAFHLGGVFIEQGRDSEVKNHVFCLGGKLTRNDIKSELAGQGAHVEMNGLVLGTGDQHIDNHTQVNHSVPHCTSDEYYKTIMDDRSRSVFRGRIVVAEDAQLTNADQQNNNLLLSDRAEADTKPQLEIYADDVKCSHGATVGQLDPKSLFYLQSRGINPESARALLTFAFANEVVERIQIDSIREELTKLLAGELVSSLEGVL